ncbi:unnamed protein product [Brugia timori]|uniref:7TM_GPCR_Srx domain-containing protein n=1 Tax=Brugia timori TaxID=42155 RepID=A0A0R3QW47_9BILA|nr:unnamed protein product [Brugia timori]
MFFLNQKMYLWRKNSMINNKFASQCLISNAQFSAFIISCRLMIIAVLCYVAVECSICMFIYC